ncbi:hypothetical protein HHK36_024944 [Tetracentron sinense]|uniref:Poly [ADP-ribose] polymerase n=1 Tax=Tetracentron sinense TaxID=13715 RepID=A0A835D4Q7_TETSI|nr:hypothetical protein HHK36_024944 [Tetracentron sinense]
MAVMENSGERCQLSSLSVGRTDGSSSLGYSNDSTTDTSSEQMENTDLGQSETETSHDQEPLASDCESCTSDASPEQFGVLGGTGMVRLEEGDREHNTIKQKFVSGMGSLGKHSTVVNIHRNSYSGFTGQARLQSFRIFSEAVSTKCGGNANIKYAWYGDSEDGICKIFSHGFSQCGNIGIYGFGIYLTPESSCIDGLKSSILDKNGLRHLLLCRVILGNMEEIHPGSQQFHPSSELFDSGVDNLLAPRRYIVWTTHMNTHILPEYVISFRAPPCLEGFQRMHEPVLKPTSPWMPFPTLISVLSKFLPPRTIGLISKYHSDYLEKKIARQHLIQQMRLIVGDKLLISIIKSFRGKVCVPNKK